MHATIGARINGLERRLDLEWVTLPGDYGSCDAEAEECVNAGCGCASEGEPSSSVWTLLGLLGLGWRLRRPVSVSV